MGSDGQNYSDDCAHAYSKSDLFIVKRKQNKITTKMVSRQINLFPYSVVIHNRELLTNKQNKMDGNEPAGKTFFHGPR